MDLILPHHLPVSAEVGQGLPGGPEDGAELKRGDEVLTSLGGHRQLPRHHSIAGERGEKEGGREERKRRRRGEEEEAERGGLGGDGEERIRS